VILVFFVAFVWMIVVAPEARQSPSARSFSHEGHEGHDGPFLERRDHRVRRGFRVDDRRGPRGAPIAERTKL
jgi:hypothetical protein